MYGFRVAVTCQLENTKFSSLEMLLTICRMPAMRAFVSLRRPVGRLYSESDIFSRTSGIVSPYIAMINVFASPSMV